jgi:hypothetical protein
MAFAIPDNHDLKKTYILFILKSFLICEATSRPGCLMMWSISIYNGDSPFTLKRSTQRPAHEGPHH